MMAKLSQNEELSIVLVLSLLSAALTYVTQLPIPLEYKTPTLGFITTIYAAIIAWWRFKVNMP